MNWPMMAMSDSEDNSGTDSAAERGERLLRAEEDLAKVAFVLKDDESRFAGATVAGNGVVPLSIFSLSSWHSENFVSQF
jgi:hypothetical protein